MLHQSFCALILLAFSWTVSATESFGYLPVENDTQKELQYSLRKGDFAKALKQWAPAVASSDFANSPSGLATWAWIIYHDGFPVLGLQTVLQTTRPAALPPELLGLWRTELNKSLYIQKGWVESTAAWRVIADNAAATLHLKTANDVERAFVRADKLPAQDLIQKARLWWQIATQAPGIDRVEPALRAIKLLRASGQSVIEADEIAMTEGRILYQKGDLTGALQAYRQISKGSSLWVESVEERAWTRLRGDDPDGALGELTTALSPVLAPLAGPETYYLAHLVNYRVCDYPRLFKNSDLFKKNHRQRLADIQILANTGNNRGTQQIIAAFESRGVSQESAGPLVSTVPRQLFRDREFVRALELRRELLAEARQSATVDDPRLRHLSEEAGTEADQLRVLALKRQQILAQIDLKEYRVVLNKMNIMEGEVIQRLHMDDNLKGQRGKLSKEEHTSNEMIFPYDPSAKEVWMDELDNYKARVKDCPTLKRASNNGSGV